MKEQRVRRLARLVGERKIPGLVVGVADGGESAVFAFGESGTRQVPDLNGQSPFETGSIAKTFTATLLADMVVRGEVRLEDPARMYLPADLAMPKDTGGITLLDLVTHSSGLRREATEPSCERGLGSPYPKTVDGLYEALGSMRPKRRRHRYSNFAFVLLAHVLGRAAGHEFESLLHERVLGPIGMTSTRLVASMKHISPVQGFVGNTRTPILPHLRLPGPGGVWTTAGDMLKWLRANLQPDTTPMGEALQLAQLPHRRFRAVLAPRPRLTLQTGLAWRVERSGVRWHTGGTRGFTTYCGFDRARGRGVVVLANFGLGAVRPREAIPAGVLALRMLRGAQRLLSG